MCLSRRRNWPEKVRDFFCFRILSLVCAARALPAAYCSHPDDQLRAAVAIVPSIHSRFDRPLIGREQWALSTYSHVLTTVCGERVPIIMTTHDTTLLRTRLTFRAR